MLGKDVSCTDSLRTGRYASGARVVAEAIYRRLITPRGMLRGGEEEANYGLDLAGLIGSATSAASEAAVPGQVRAEILKDERIESAEVTLLKTEQGPATIYQLTVEATTSEGPFTLTLAASAVTVELLGIQEAA